MSSLEPSDSAATLTREPRRPRRRAAVFDRPDLSDAIDRRSIDRRDDATDNSLCCRVTDGRRPRKSDESSPRRFGASSSLDDSDSTATAGAALRFEKLGRRRVDSGSEPSSASERRDARRGRSSPDAALETLPRREPVDRRLREGVTARSRSVESRAYSPGGRCRRRIAVTLDGKASPTGPANSEPVGSS